jgi:hypothetical protein
MRKHGKEELTGVGRWLSNKHTKYRSDKPEYQ